MGPKTWAREFQTAVGPAHSTLKELRTTFLKVTLRVFDLSPVACNFGDWCHPRWHAEVVRLALPNAIEVEEAGSAEGYFHSPGLPDWPRLLGFLDPKGPQDSLFSFARSSVRRFRGRLVTPVVFNFAMAANPDSQRKFCAYL